MRNSKETVGYVVDIRRHDCGWRWTRRTRRRRGGRLRTPYMAKHCAWMDAVSHLVVMLEAAVDTDI